MRVAFITFSTVPFGPNDLLFYNAAMTLVERGHTVMVSALDWAGQHAKEYEVLAARGALMHLRPRPVRPSRFFARQWQRFLDHFCDPQKTWKSIGDFAPEVLVIADAATYHMISAAGFWDYVQALTIPTITLSQYNDENTSLGEPVLSRARSLFANARHCVFVSRRNLDVAKRQLCLTLNQGVVIDNPPNLISWELLPFPAGERATMAMVARFECGVKGQALMLQLMSEPAWLQRDWELTLYGRGPDENYLRDLISFLGLGQRVRIGGHVNGIKKIWERTMLLVMPSSGEGKPLALTEAMLCARPAVVTDVGGNAELIEEGLSGFVAQSATLASLRETMERAWAARSKWPGMGQAAHQVMRKRLDPPPGDRLAELILSSPGGAA